jgi:cell division protein FtsQ
VAASRLSLGWTILGALALVAAVWWGGPWTLRQVDFFRVRRIEITGARYLAPKTITTAMALRREASVFDDLGAMEHRLRGVAGVVRAEVGRRLPGTLTVTVVETEPVALIPRRSVLTPVDDHGRVLPYDPAQVAPDLPIATSADSGLTRVLATLRVEDPTLFGRVARASLVQNDVLLDVDGRRFWFSANATAEDVRAVTAVAQDLARQQRVYRELDGRYAGQVIVRWAGA